MLEILLIICVLLLSSIIVYLIFFYNKKKKSTEENSSKKHFYNLIQTKSTKDVDVVLTVNYIDYQFTHSVEKSKEIKKIGDFIKESIIIMETSKYNDIIESRSDEINIKLQQLLGISTFSKEQYSKISGVIKDFANQLKK